MDEMNQRLTRIETTFFNNNGYDWTIQNNHHRGQRAILSSTLPPCTSKLNCAFDFKDNKDRDEQISKPPSSCMDLRKNGHVLNGFYPLKKWQSKG